MTFGTFLQRKVHLRFSVENETFFSVEQKTRAAKPPASFLFHCEFVICLFAFLYDKSVFECGFIK